MEKLSTVFKQSVHFVRDKKNREFVRAFAFAIAFGAAMMVQTANSAYNAGRRDQKQDDLDRFCEFGDDIHSNISPK